LNRIQKIKKDLPGLSSLNDRWVFQAECDLILENPFFILQILVRTFSNREKLIHEIFMTKEELEQGGFEQDSKD